MFHLDSAGELSSSLRQRFVPDHIEALFAVPSRGSSFCPVLPAALTVVVLTLPHPTGVSKVITAGSARVETNPNVRLPGVSSEYLKLNAQHGDGGKQGNQHHWVPTVCQVGYSINLMYNALQKTNRYREDK